MIKILTLKSTLASCHKKFKTESAVDHEETRAKVKSGWQVVLKIESRLMSSPMLTFCNRQCQAKTNSPGLAFPQLLHIALFAHTEVLKASPWQN